jgi:hypothetical protein
MALRARFLMAELVGSVLDDEKRAAEIEFWRADAAF